MEELRWPNWNSVRNLAALQVLTRASYSALVVVPMLAAVWTTFVGGIPLPNFLGLAFFAALLVVVGHLVFQLRAPELVKAKRLADHVRQSLVDLEASATDARLARAKSCYTEWTGREYPPNPPDAAPALKAEWARGLVSKGAAAEYCNQASVRRVSAAACTVLYLGAMLLIVRLVVNQTVVVWEACGWSL